MQLRKAPFEIFVSSEFEISTISTLTKFLQLQNAFIVITSILDGIETCVILSIKNVFRIKISDSEFV